MSGPILLYGATGYTGWLVAAELAGAGLDPVLAGRREAALRAIARPLGLDVRVGGLDDVDLGGVTALLNCAGPFAVTAPPLAGRCVAAGVHYLDLAGEVPEHQAVAAHDAAARRAGVLLLPGAGYGIVASDCLAAHVAAHVEEVRSVEVALKTVGGVSRGTAEVLLGSLRVPGVVRRAGRLTPARAGAERRRVDFTDGDGPTTVVTNPWRADLAAGVPQAPDYQAFMAFPAPVRLLMRLPHPARLLRRLARRLPEGPDEKALATGRSAVWARAVGADGTAATAVLHGPEAYVLTARAAAACLRRAVDGGAPAGHRTLAGAWGPELALAISGVTRTDIV